MSKKAMPKAYSSVSKGKASPITVFVFAFLMVYILILFVPIIWSLFASVTNYTDYKIFYYFNKGNPFSFSKATLENYSYAWKNLSITTIETDRHKETTFNILGLFSNSLLYSVGCAVAATLVPLVVGYAAARFRFRFSKIIYGFVLVTMALPIVGSMASELRMLKTLGIDESFPGMWILRSHFLTIYFLIFYAQFQSIPMDYTEAAKVDGASNLRIMFRVIIPQAFGTILTIFILNFIGFWNDYQIPLVYLPSYPTVAYCIYYFVNVPQNGSITSYLPVKMAATIVMTLPIVIVFIIFNKRLRVGVSMGGIKG